MSWERQRPRWLRWSGGREGPPCSALHRPSIAHRTAKGAACWVAVEKDNGVPSVDSRASGYEKRSRFEQCHSARGFIAEREKGSRNAEGFCIGKNERK